jgi:hypothetical protein
MKDMVTTDERKRWNVNVAVSQLHVKPVAGTIMFTGEQPSP